MILTIYKPLPDIRRIALIALLAVAPGMLSCTQSDDDNSGLLLLAAAFLSQTCETNPERCELSGFTSATSSAAKVWAAATFANNQFVAVAQDTGATNTVMTSTDGRTWTGRTAADSEQWLGIAHGNNIYVAIANSGTTNRGMTSTDGVTWTARALPGAGTVAWSNVVFGNGRFLAISPSTIAVSLDGINWTSVTGPTGAFEGAAFGNGLFVIVATGGQVATSPDGSTWTARTAAEANDWRAVTFGKNTFVAVADTGTNRVMTSPDGINWTARSAAENNEWYGVHYANGLFMAVAFTGTNRAMTSLDGITWTARTPLATNQYRGVTFGNDTFTAVSINGTVAEQVQYATWRLAR